MSSNIDEVSISELIMIDNFCPHCEEELILESLRFIMFEEDVVDAFNYYKENVNLCKYCLAELNI